MTKKQEHGSTYRALRTIKPLRRMVRVVRDFLERYRPATWLLEGTEHHSGQLLRVFFAGLLENKNYFARLAFGGNHAEIERGGMWFWSVFRLARNSRADHDLAIIDMDIPIGRHLKSQDSFLVPNWVRGEVDLAVAMKQIQRSDSVKTDLRKIRWHGYRYEVTKDEREFERFYHEMYLPYVRQTYAGMMVLMPHVDMRNYMARSELLLIKSGAEAVAGLMLLHDGTIVRAYALGVKDGDTQYVKSGALAATYYFAILYLAERGNQRLHLGGSRPFLRDGVLQYKKKWGTRIVDHSPNSFVFTPTHNTMAVKSFFANNPFFFEAAGTLSGAIFVAREFAIPDERIQRWHKDFVEMGISRVQIFELKGRAGVDAWETPGKAAISQYPSGRD